MVYEKRITSLQNPFVKEVVRLRQRSCRDESGLFLIEGYREMRRALDAKWSMRTLYSCPELFLGENEERLIDDAIEGGARHIVCSEAVFRKIAYRDRPDGLLSVAPQRRRSLSEPDDHLTKKGGDPLIVVAESIEKPGNLGTILRSCDATGVTALLLCDRCTDLYNPNVVRASIGTLFTVPVFDVGSEEAVSWLKERKITIAAATPRGARSWCQESWCRPMAVAVGTEQLGLSDRWLEAADLQISIPMLGVADSLNVATATTLLLYESVRQRHGLDKSIS